MKHSLPPRDGPQAAFPPLGTAAARACILAAAVLALVAAVPEGGAGAPVPTAAARPEPPVRVSLVAEQDGVAPGGKVELGVLLVPRPGWHLYWHGRSDSGAPISVDLVAPPYVRLGLLRWPAPRRLVSPGGILDHVYEGPVLLPVTAQVGGDTRSGEELHFRAVVDWVVCSDVCVAGFDSLSLTVPVLDRDAVPERTAAAPLFEAAARRLPRRLSSRSEARGAGLAFSWEGTTFVVDGPGDSLVFYPAADCGDIPDLLHEGVAPDGRMRLHFRPRDGRVGPARGVLEADPPGGAPPLFFSLDDSCPEQPGR